ncbi:DUF3768 domain-containing protein [Devosia sp.]|uniref:DUF3768 domain-containing protein n=1 Tax=Devosia sp. TaxID=1871048 RepID=UPI001ACD07D3|nr:DUF3768 domain-containing protein [Devosia sp.]MBN9309667.1 DUF3768 domain-containing protein [Devosia sp.]
MDVPSQRDPDLSGRIAILNDAFRATFLGGSICVTAAVQERGAEFVKAALLRVRDFKTFGPENDPHGEHDFGAFAIDEQRLYWTIDYYDPSMRHGSEDPSRPDITRRVLTVMFWDEY